MAAPQMDCVRTAGGVTILSKTKGRSDVPVAYRLRLSDGDVASTFPDRWIAIHLYGSGYREVNAWTRP